MKLVSQIENSEVGRQILRYQGQPMVRRPDGHIDALLLQLNVRYAHVELQAGNSNQPSV